MSKKTKLKLDELKVQSFVTECEKHGDLQLIKGGVLSVTCGCTLITLFQPHCRTILPLCEV